jgi:hypothetical protein
MAENERKRHICLCPLDLFSSMNKGCLFFDHLPKTYVISIVTCSEMSKKKIFVHGIGGMWICFSNPKFFFLSVMQELHSLITVVHLIQRNYPVAKDPEFLTSCHNHSSPASIPGWWIKSHPHYLFLIYLNNPPRNRQSPERSSSSQVVQLCINVPQFPRRVTLSHALPVLCPWSGSWSFCEEYRLQILIVQLSLLVFLAKDLFWCRKLVVPLDTAGIEMPVLQNTVSNSNNTDQEMMKMNTQGKRNK